MDDKIIKNYEEFKNGAKQKTSDYLIGRIREIDILYKDFHLSGYMEKLYRMEKEIIIKELKTRNDVTEDLVSYFATKYSPSVLVE